MGLFGKDPAKEAADEAREAEEKRQAEIRSGVEQINQIFYGGPIYEDRPVQRQAQQAQPEGLSAKFGQAPPGVSPPRFGQPQLGGLLSRFGQAKRPGFGQLVRSRFPGIEPQTRRVQVGTSKGFDDDFYSGIQKSYQDYYMPQIAEQYGEAKTDLKSLLSGQGILSSSAGQRRFSDMLKDYEEGRRQITSRGLGKAQQARGQMEDIRADLIGQLEGGMGIGSVTDIARSRASALRNQPQYEPLADMFQAGTGVLANAAAAERAGRRGLGGAATKFLSPFGSGTARVY